jgi:hypothetical protein
MSTVARLHLALEKLQPPQWSLFEQLASAFLSTEFENLRTVASANGDDGRDSELFSPEQEPTVAFQYSVATNWKAKITGTGKRISSTLPKIQFLIYLTNQSIGANGDALKKTFRENFGLSLDIRDKSYFLERCEGDLGRRMASELLATAIVDPFLAQTGVGPYAQSTLSTPEAIAAVTFLNLQWQDDNRDKGLTKLVFEALVRAVLVGTDSQRLMSRCTIHEKIDQILPHGQNSSVANLVDGSLKRLSKSRIKHWPINDEFCLAHEEATRFSEFQVKTALAEHNLNFAISGISASLLDRYSLPDDVVSEFEQIFRITLDRVLFERSQAFAMAVSKGSLQNLADQEFETTILQVLSSSSLPKVSDLDWKLNLKLAIRSALTSDDAAIQTYLRSLSDSYTLLAFLNQTPDVQGVVEKMFSHGQLWLDTTVLLPLLTDTLFDEPDEVGRFTRMINAAISAGLRLHVTPGVVEEVERHMNRSLACSRMPTSQWDGSIPFMFERYIAIGRDRSMFSKWLENFRGDNRPLDDLTEYLELNFQIKKKSLDDERKRSSTELRAALSQIWHDRYERHRLLYKRVIDPMIITALVDHDIECYAGVVQIRKSENLSPFGYGAWWLTVDRQTYDLKSKLRERMTETPPDSPVMSADFLINYLAFGPMRKFVPKAKESRLPLLMLLSNVIPLTQELIEEAAEIRKNIQGLPERVIQRQVRDGLDRARATLGVVAKLGMDDLDRIDDFLPLG